MIKLARRVVFEGLFLQEPGALRGRLAAHPSTWQAAPAIRAIVAALSVLDYACDRNDTVGALARDAMRRPDLLPILIDYCDEIGPADLSSAARTLRTL